MSQTKDTFLVSAPGKVIVFGEHAVVHGKAAIAASISLRSYMLVTPLHTSDRIVSIEFPDIGLQHSWSIDSLPWSIFTARSQVDHTERITKCDPQYIKALQPHVDSIPSHASEFIQKQHKTAVLAFLYLFLSLSSADSQSCMYSLRSTIPAGAGLGSSASVSVCISAALLRQAGVLQDPAGLSKVGFEASIDIINNWAFVGEMCIHGNPSGVDNTVATRGKAVLFKRYDRLKPPSVIPIQKFPILDTCIVDTKQPRSTLVEVAKVQNLKDRHSRAIEPVLEAIDNISEEAHALLTSPSFNPSDEESLTTLGQLISINHGLLVSLGVSHPKLERVKMLMDENNLGWTKLTGAGGGGCAFTLLRPEVSHQELEKMEAALESLGFGRYHAQLGGNGVGLRDELSCKSPSKITREEFLVANDHTTFDKVVNHDQSLHWQYWNTA